MRVIKTITKKYFIIRFRECENGHKLKTKEQSYTQWNYRKILLKVKEDLYGVK